jgi:hypothetical protein
MKRRHVIATALGVPAVLSAGCSSLGQTPPVLNRCSPASPSCLTLFAVKPT